MRQLRHLNTLYLLRYTIRVEDEDKFQQHRNILHAVSIILWAIHIDKNKQNSNMKKLSNQV